MRDSDIDALSADGAQDTRRLEHHKLVLSGLHECADDCPPLESPAPVSRYADHYYATGRTYGPRIWYTDRQGRRRWRAALPGELRGE